MMSSPLFPVRAASLSTSDLRDEIQAARLGLPLPTELRCLPVSMRGRRTSVPDARGLPKSLPHTSMASEMTASLSRSLASHMICNSSLTRSSPAFVRWIEFAFLLVLKTDSTPDVEAP
eukprot:7357774-Lingulodinium_polyedra.AAC.1